MENNVSTTIDCLLLSKAGKVALSECLKKEGLDGLFASILIRLTMGESADLGPDNMLVVKDKDGRNQVVNIDITGFRYPREKDFWAERENKLRFGWKDIIQNPDTSLDKLLNGSVFSGRYVDGINALQHAVTDVLKKVLGSQASNEVGNIRDWYASLDAETSKSSLKDLTQTLFDSLDGSIKPDNEQMLKAINTNCSFIDAAVNRCKSHAPTVVELHSEGFSLNSLG